MFQAALALGLCCLIVQGALGDKTLNSLLNRHARHSRSEETVSPDCVHRNKECPKYRVLKNITSSIEQRHLSDNLYAYIDTNTCNISTAFDVGYSPLHSYFGGANSRNETIQRLPPVVLVHKTRENPPEGCTFAYNLMFHMPSELHFNASKPMEDGVELYWLTARNIFALKLNYSSMSDELWYQKAAELQSVVDDSGYCYDNDVIAFATYDAFFRPRPHRREIWIHQEECQTSASCKQRPVEALKLASLAALVLVLVLASDG